MFFTVALDADHGAAHACSCATAVPFQIDDLAALGIGAPAELRVTEDLFVGEEQFVLLEGALVDELLDPLLLKPDVAVRAP